MFSSLIDEMKNKLKNIKNKNIKRDVDNTF